MNEPIIPFPLSVSSDPEFLSKDVFNCVAQKAFVSSLLKELSKCNITKAYGSGEEQTTYLQKIRNSPLKVFVTKDTVFNKNFEHGENPDEVNIQMNWRQIIMISVEKDYPMALTIKNSGLGDKLWLVVNQTWYFEQSGWKFKSALLEKFMEITDQPMPVEAKKANAGRRLKEDLEWLSSCNLRVVPSPDFEKVQQVLFPFTLPNVPLPESVKEQFYKKLFKCMAKNVPPPIRITKNDGDLLTIQIYKRGLDGEEELIEKIVREEAVGDDRIIDNTTEPEDGGNNSWKNKSKKALRKVVSTMFRTKNNKSKQDEKVVETDEEGNVKVDVAIFENRHKDKYGCYAYKVGYVPNSQTPCIIKLGIPDDCKIASEVYETKLRFSKVVPLCIVPFSIEEKCMSLEKFLKQVREREGEEEANKPFVADPLPDKEKESKDEGEGSPTAKKNKHNYYNRLFSKINSEKEEEKKTKGDENNNNVNSSVKDSKMEVTEENNDDKETVEEKMNEDKKEAYFITQITYDWDSLKSLGNAIRDSEFFYEVGKEIDDPNFDPNTSLICTGGIHGFITQGECFDFYMGPAHSILRSMIIGHDRMDEIKEPLTEFPSSNPDIFNMI